MRALVKISRVEGDLEMRSRAARLWRLLIAMGFLSAPPHLPAAECLEYASVSLTGRLVRQTYPGPPDYESITKGDEPQVIWVLLLDRRICVAGPDPRYPRQYLEREVQVVLTADQYLRYKDLLGERIIATGDLLSGGARYDKRLVLAASEITKARVLP